MLLRPQGDSLSRTKVFACLAATAATAALSAGCGSSSQSATGGSSPSQGAAAGKSYTIGILTDVTGLAASGNKTTVEGVKAGLEMAARAGVHLKYVVADTQTSPMGALTGATRLVQQDKVSAVIAVSAVTFAAAPYLTAHHVPVVGTNIDGTEWLTSKNMFSVFGYVDQTKVPLGIGRLLKQEGGTVVGTLGYGISPSSSESAKGTALSAKAAGLKSGYVNSNFTFGSTDVQPIAIAMKDAGVDSVYSSTDPNTSFALITALKNLGHKVKVAEFPIGYGGDLTQAGPGALDAAQGVIFGLNFEPVEMHTAATKQFASDLSAVGVKGEPTLAEYEGYASVAALVDALKVAGAPSSGPALISSLAGIKNFDAAGLLGTHGYDLNNRTSSAAGPDGCIYYTRLVGSTFELVPDADPLCAGILQK